MLVKKKECLETSYLALVKIDHPCSCSIIVVDSNPGKVTYGLPLTSSMIVKQMSM